MRKLTWKILYISELLTWSRRPGSERLRFIPLLMQHVKLVCFILAMPECSTGPSRRLFDHTTAAITTFPFAILFRHGPDITEMKNIFKGGKTWRMTEPRLCKWGPGFVSTMNHFTALTYSCNRLRIFGNKHATGLGHWKVIRQDCCTKRY